MAEYIKFRLTAAKVGVSMALMALIAGIAEKVQTAPNQVHATRAAANFFLKLDGIPGETKKAFKTLEVKWSKLSTNFVKVESKLVHNYYDKLGINGNFLKISDASGKYLKISDANGEFMKIADANAQFMKYGSTAADSNLLGNLPPSAFVQGHGDVVSGAASVAPGQSQQLLSTPDGAISILIGLSQPAAGGPSSTPTLTIHNGTGNVMPAVQDLGTSAPGQSSSVQTSSHDLKPGDNSVPLAGGASQLHLQIFPSGGSNEVVTITVSAEPALSGGGFSAVGQLLLGN